MELEPKKKTDHLKRRYRSSSEDPNELSNTLKRVKKTAEEYLMLEPVSKSTVFFIRPFAAPSHIRFEVEAKRKVELTANRIPLVCLSMDSFEEEYTKIVETAESLLGKKQTKGRTKNKKKVSLIESKKEAVENYFICGIKDFVFISKQVNLSQQQIRYLWLKFQGGKSVTHDYRGNKKKLGETHCEFIKEFFTKPNNFDKTIIDLHSSLVDNFNLNPGYVSYWTLYDYVHSLSLSYKKITYRSAVANNLTIKQKRIDSALSILSAHVQGYEFIYIDEVSFNLELRSDRGWGPIGKKIRGIKPNKSINYSVIAAMDIEGILGIKVVKGGVRSSEFASYMIDICNEQNERIKGKKVLFFMDNAKIHRSKDFMQKFEKFYNVQYNAPYTPQFNPIEFAFSKLKAIVKKRKPTSEENLVRDILKACLQIEKKDCANYIVHSLKFLRKAMDKEDLY